MTIGSNKSGSNLFYKDGNMYTWGDQAGKMGILGPNGTLGHGIGSFLSNPKLAEVYLNSGVIQNLGAVGGQQQAPAPTPAVPVQTGKDLQNQYNRLAGQASNALNGGLLGYQPSEIKASGSNPQTFTGPIGSFRFPFGLLNGMGG